MLWAVCKSRPLDHTCEIIAGLWHREAELCRVVLWGWGLWGQQHPSLPSPRQEAHGGPEAAESSCRQRQDGGTGGKVHVQHILLRPRRRIHQPPSVYSTLLVTRSRCTGSSCPAPLLLFVFFCFLLLETEHLMEKGCSPAPCAGNTRFLPPLPGTEPGAAQTAAPAAPFSCCPTSGSPYGSGGGQV